MNAAGCHCFDLNSLETKKARKLNFCRFRGGGGGGSYGKSIKMLSTCVTYGVVIGTLFLAVFTYHVSKNVECCPFLNETNIERLN